MVKNNFVKKIEKFEKFIPHMSTIAVVIMTIMLQAYILHSVNVVVNALSGIPLIGVIIESLFAGLNTMWFFGTLIIASIVGVLIELQAFKKDKNKFGKATAAVLFVVLFSFLVELVL